MQKSLIDTQSMITYCTYISDNEHFPPSNFSEFSLSYSDYKGRKLDRNFVFYTKLRIQLIFSPCQEMQMSLTNLSCQMLPSFIPIFSFLNWFLKNKIGGNIYS